MRQKDSQVRAGVVYGGVCNAVGDSLVVVCLHESVNGQDNVCIQSGGAEESKVSEETDEWADADFIQDKGVELSFTSSSDGRVLWEEMFANHGNRSSLEKRIRFEILILLFF